MFKVKFLTVIEKKNNISGDPLSLYKKNDIVQWDSRDGKNNNFVKANSRWCILGGTDLLLNQSIYQPVKLFNLNLWPEQKKFPWWILQYH